MFQRKFVTMRLKKIAAILFTALLLPAASFAAPAVSRYNHYWLPDANSTYAPEIDGIFNVILWVTMVVFVLVEVGLVYFVWKYRHKKDRIAVYTHGNNRLEIAWTIVPVVILVFLA